MLEKDFNCMPIRSDEFSESNLSICDRIDPKFNLSSFPKIYYKDNDNFRRGVLCPDEAFFKNFETAFNNIFRFNTDKSILFDIGPRYTDKEKYQRRKFDEDNICKKIKICYMNSTTKLINFIIFEKLGENNKEFEFKSIYHLNKKYFSQKYITNEFRQKTIEQVLEINEFNKNICNKIKTEPKLRDVYEILQKNIFFFFDNFFYQKRKNIYNLNEFGLSDFEFYLPKEIELFDDLLLRNKDLEFFNTYETKMRECCRKYFIIKENKFIFNTRKISKKK